MKWCFLKSDFNQLNSFPGAVAGKIVETAAANEPDIGAAPALPFLSDNFVRSARDAKSRLTLADELKGQGVESLTALGRIELTSGNVDHALNAFQGALSLAPDNGDLWVEMARAANRINEQYRRRHPGGLRCPQRLSACPARRGAAPMRSPCSPPRCRTRRIIAQALSAYKASLALVESQTVRAAYDDLSARQGFRVTGNTIDNDSATPRACVQFSETLVKSRRRLHALRHRSTARAPKARRSQGQRRSASKASSHGQRYKIVAAPRPALLRRRGP